MSCLLVYSAVLGPSAVASLSSLCIQILFTGTARNQAELNNPWRLNSLYYIICPCRKVLEQCFPLFLGWLKIFFLQDCSLSLRSLGRWPLGTKVYVGTYGQSLSWHAGEVSRGCSQTRSVLLHTCYPAGAAHTGSSTALWCRTGHPMHKGPLWTICKAPDNFYLPLPVHSSQCLFNLSRI